AGWTVTGASDGGTPDGNYVRWAEFGTPANATYTYTVQIPGDAALGLHTFSGDYNLGSGTNAIDCDTQINVVGEPGEPAEQNVCRDLTAKAQLGDEITVELAITVDGADRILIDEMAPAGWTVTGASDGGTPDGNYVRWAKFDTPVNATYTYTVQIPGDAAQGLHTFSGDYNLGSGTNAIDCDTQVEVEVVVIPEGIVLLPGWNFVSVPYELENPSVDYVLADINYSLPVTYYSASTGLFETVSDLEPLKGYWIKNPEEGIQVILGELLVPKEWAVPATLTVYEGWNAIGYTDPKYILDAETALTSIDESYTTIMGPFKNDPYEPYEQVGWNGQTGVINGIHVGTDVFYMGPYEAFWVLVTQEDMLGAV
ncbi:hypothetical protein GQ473_05210, partial [archaeon]|nr:hypothetical protein [archaeon]